MLACDLSVIEWAACYPEFMCQCLVLVKKGEVEGGKQKVREMERRGRREGRQKEKECFVAE